MESNYRLEAENHYGTHQHLYAQQRDGFVKGCEFMEQQNATLIEQNKKLREFIKETCIPYLGGRATGEAMKLLNETE